MTKQEAYQARLGTVEGALELVRSGDCITTSCYGNEPIHFLRQLHTAGPRVEGVCLWMMNNMEDYPVISDPALEGHIDFLSAFYGPACRRMHPVRRVSLVPGNLHSIAASTIRARRPTVHVCAVSPMDPDGRVSLAFDLEASLEWMEAADRVIFEINPNIPRMGGETMVPIEAADYLYEVEDSPLPYAPATPASPVEEKIAEYVSSLIRDGDCIQLGIGGMPGAVGEKLLDKRDLGVHTEMITASMGRLMRSGAVNNSRKNLNPGKSVGAFAWGDQALYDLMAGGGMIEMRRCSYTNDPFVIAQNDNMVSVNTALELDLTGQICSESVGPRQFSGTGGACDFAYGAYHSKGGRGIVAITSTAKGGAVSKLKAQLTPGAVVSIPRNLADYVVTEYGIAPLRDRTIRQKVENLIAVAHPDFRAELRRQADQWMLW